MRKANILPHKSRSSERLVTNGFARLENRLRTHEIVAPDTRSGGEPVPPDAPPMPPIGMRLAYATPERAAHWLKLSYARQRPVRKFHVIFLAHMLRLGHFRPGTQITFAVLADGTKTLINGHHTLLAIIESGVAVWLEVQEIAVADEHDASQLYDTFDRHLARSMADLYAADSRMAQTVLTRRQIKIMGAAMPWIASGFQDDPFHRNVTTTLLRDGRLRLLLIQDWQQDAELAFKDCTGPLFIQHTLERSAVFSVILATYRYQPEAASPFWRAIARNAHTDEQAPGKALLTFLLNAPARTVDSMRYLRVVATAWNAHMAGKRFKQLRVTTEHRSAPMTLTGTPYDGTRILRALDSAGAVHHYPLEVEYRGESD